MNEEITYIAKRYRKGKFSVDKGWKRLNIKPALKWNGLKIAAAVASVVVLSATAAIIYHQYELKDTTDKIVNESVRPLHRWRLSKSLILKTRRSLPSFPKLKRCMALRLSMFRRMPGSIVFHCTTKVTPLTL